MVAVWCEHIHSLMLSETEHTIHGNYVYNSDTGHLLRCFHWKPVRSSSHEGKKETISKAFVFFSISYIIKPGLWPNYLQNSSYPPPPPPRIFSNHCGTSYTLNLELPPQKSTWWGSMGWEERPGEAPDSCPGVVVYGHRVT